MNWRREVNLFSIALAFFTRIPVPWPVDYSQTSLNQASRYFPLVGWVIGGCTALVTWAWGSVLPEMAAILLGMLFSVLLTGAFHEDGLADTADGLGGGWTREKKLGIMKDSRLGTYGAVALWFALSLKFMLLWALMQRDLTVLALALLVAHPLSRGVSTGLIFTLPYVTETREARSKPLAESQRKEDFLIAVVVSIPALFLVPSATFWLVSGLMLIGWGAHRFLKKQIGGFTGDTLGAVQQVTELSCYLLILASLGGSA